MQVIVLVIVGLIAGWLAGLIRHGRGFGVAGNLLVGVIGAALGGLIFPLLGIHASSLLARILLATLGALGLLWALGVIDRGGRRSGARSR